MQEDFRKQIKNEIRKWSMFHSSKKFNEAKELIERGGIFSIKNTTEFIEVASTLFTNVIQREKAGLLNYNYIKSKAGATDTFIHYILDNSIEQETENPKGEEV